MKNIIKQVIVAIFVIIIVFLLFYNCTGKQTEQKEVTTQGTSSDVKQPSYTNECYTLYTDALKNDSIILEATEIDINVANKAIKSFSDFSFYCKTDSLAPIYLLKAGQIAMSINNIPQAKLSFERVLKDFPEFENRGAAMFLLAQLYDEPQFLNDEDKARELYERVMSNFPGTDWARNAEAARNLLGKTDEQIAHEFLKNAKKK